MAKKSQKDLIMLVLSVLMIVGAMLIGGCVQEPPQIIESITPEEALALVQENQDNPNFVILDLRFPESFAYKHIKGAINIEYLSQNFRDELEKLDRDKTYLVYSGYSCGNVGPQVLDMMKELNFREVYSMTGMCYGQELEGFPTVGESTTNIIKNITPEQALALVQENQENPDFVFIDIQTPEAFAQEHIENAINLDYSSENFQDELDKLDKDKTYLVYYTGLGGDISGKTLDLMSELNFTEVYNISGGLDQWKAEGLPTVHEEPPTVIERITPQDAFALIQENPDFVIIDIRTPEAFAQEHIENAINLDYFSDNFRDELDKLDKDETYLIYYTCACGGIDENTLDIMTELNFTEVYNISGGLDQWIAEGLPLAHEEPPQIIESITPQEAFALTQKNQDNPDFVIIDIRTPEAFVQEHIEDAINIDYRSEDFRDELDKLDKDKIYLIYYSCACGGIDGKALNMMAELGFKEVYKISGGLDQWIAEGLQP